MPRFWDVKVSHVHTREPSFVLSTKSNSGQVLHCGHHWPWS